MSGLGLNYVPVPSFSRRRWALLCRGPSYLSFTFPGPRTGVTHVSPLSFPLSFRPQPTCLHVGPPISLRSGLDTQNQSVTFVNFEMRLAPSRLRPETRLLPAQTEYNIVLVRWGSATHLSPTFLRSRFRPPSDSCNQNIRSSVLPPNLTPPPTPQDSHHPKTHGGCLRSNPSASFCSVRTTGL